jgi:hypothetical protein
MMRYLFLFFILLEFTSCRTFRELKALTKCEFRNKDFARLEVSGLNLLQYQDLSQINLLEAGKLALQMAKQPEVPMFVTFNVEVRNSHEKLAALEKLDWILEVDKRDVVSGTSVDRFEVPPMGTNTLPIQTSFDLKKILSKTSLDGIFALVKGMNGTNEEDTRIRLKIKPRFRIAGARIGYPGYIKIGKTFESSKVEK